MRKRQGERAGRGCEKILIALITFLKNAGCQNPNRETFAPSFATAAWSAVAFPAGPVSGRVPS
jgi:hypothetical protein